MGGLTLRLLASHSVGDKSIRLYSGDLSAIPPEQAVDVLIVSAFPNDYLPTRSSLIGALFRRGISVGALANEKAADLRSTFCSWLSHDLSGKFPHAGFRRILCFESALRGAPHQTVGDVFRALMPFALDERQPIQSVAMPLLATGDQGFDAEVMLRAIFEAGTHWLKNGLPTTTIKLVLFDEPQAARLAGAFERLSAAQGKSVRSFTEVAPAASFDFFLSYAHEDTQEADQLVDALQSARPGTRIFQDKLLLNPGQSWQVELDSALEAARNVIALYSPAYLASKMCIEEFNMARLRHRESDAGILRPVYLRSANLPLYMRSLQYLDCREGDKSTFPNVARTLVSVCG